MFRKWRVRLPEYELAIIIAESFNFTPNPVLFYANRKRKSIVYR